MAVNANHGAMISSQQSQKNQYDPLIQMQHQQSQPYVNYNLMPQVSHTQNYDPSYQPQMSSQIPEWKTQVSKKRARKESPDKPQRTSKQTKIKDYWLNTPIITPNQYAALNQNDDSSVQSSNEADKDEKVPKPPPIFVAGVGNITPLMLLLEEIAKQEYELKVLRNDEVKIQPQTSEKYRIIVKALTDKNTEFHTYQTKEERSFRVVLRNMHHTTDIDVLKDEIQQQGHIVTNICNIRQRGTKKPLPLFFIELKQGHNNQDIYKVERLMNSRVKFEPPHQKREIPQCVKCQRYGHTKKFCNRSARCVKCAGEHATTECPRKDKNNEVKCILCNGNHPANYKGCAVYKELQKKKYPALREKQIRIPKQLVNTNLIQPGMSYAQMARDNTRQIQTDNNAVRPQLFLPQQNNDMQELKQMMRGLMEQMGTMLNLLTTLISKMA